MLRLLMQAAAPEKYGRTGNQAAVKGVPPGMMLINEEEHWRLRYEAEDAGMYAGQMGKALLLKKLHMMHTRMCDRPDCRECHPENFFYIPEGDPARERYPGRRFAFGEISRAADEWLLQLDGAELHNWTRPFTDRAKAEGRVAVLPGYKEREPPKKDWQGRPIRHVPQRSVGTDLRDVV